jgi:SRSO17 transposase
MLVLDDTGLPKQNKSSVGMQHQYSSTAAANKEAAKSWSALDMSSIIQTRASHCDFPLSAHFHLPEAWIEDRGRYQDTHVPEPT